MVRSIKLGEFEKCSPNYVFYALMVSLKTFQEHAQTRRYKKKICTEAFFVLKLHMYKIFNFFVFNRALGGRFSIETLTDVKELVNLVFLPWYKYPSTWTASPTVPLPPAEGGFRGCTVTMSDWAICWTAPPPAENCF